MKWEWRNLEGWVASVGGRLVQVVGQAQVRWRRPGRRLIEPTLVVKVDHGRGNGLCVNCSEEKIEILCVDLGGEKNDGREHGEGESRCRSDVIVRATGMKADVDPLRCEDPEMWIDGDREVGCQVPLVQNEFESDGAVSVIDDHDRDERAVVRG